MNPTKQVKAKKLKSRTQKSRNGTRKSTVSLDKKDHELNTVARAVCHELYTKEPVVAESSYNGMKTHGRHIIRNIGDKPVSELTIEDIDELKTTLLRQGKKGKVINGCYTILRAVCSKAFSSGQQSSNLMTGIENLKVVNDDPFPFSEDEVRQLLLTDTDFPMGKEMSAFGVLAALRISELICACWENVEFYIEEGIEKCRLYVDLAKPLNLYKVTKTEESQRTIELSAEAAQLLRKLEPVTGNKAAICIDVVQRDNITVTRERRKFIFFNEQTGHPWLNPKQFAKQFFTGFLKDAGVAHRGPNQLRHTGASIQFNRGVSVAWIAELLGHRDVSIVEKHYAKRNKVSLKKEQAKADKTVAELFNTSDENSIMFPHTIAETKQITKPVANDDKAFIQNLLQLARAAKNDEHREQIYKIIDQTLQGGL
ncbi:tyrosine-type recombinase/integrase [Vibrio cyclitrophicus]|uniref:tyrosine-type recombinase/integrase n=1 Tax=Vibrio TaxID=662 RepID=UPI001F53B315|nr:MULTISPECIES: tyrosine-type recombinase/integrase [Vibrio]UOE82700.1 tyrosine-type recombinase/integrase [Vibrio splendidus]